MMAIRREKGRMAHESPREEFVARSLPRQMKAAASLREPTPALGLPCSKRRADGWLLGVAGCFVNSKAPPAADC